MSEQDKQVSVSWKYLANILIVVLIGFFGWFGTIVWGRQNDVENKANEIPLLRQSVELLTKAVDRLTTRFDDAATQQSQNNLNRPVRK